MTREYDILSRHTLSRHTLSLVILSLVILSRHTLSYGIIWGGYDQQAPEKYRSLVQNIVSFIGLFCKRDLYF